MRFFNFRLICALLVLLAIPLQGFAASFEAPEEFDSNNPECINIFYDQTEDSDYILGRIYAIFLVNLTGHFPKFQTYVEPVANYKSGRLDACRASIYVGSYYNNPLPAEFLEDIENTDKNFAWLGYNVWNYPHVERDFGVRFRKLTTLDTRLDEAGEPGFYKWISYKGEEFDKFSEYSISNPNVFIAPFEMAEIEVLDSSVEVLASARHSVDKSVLPYAIRKENRFYFTDVPMSFMHESDRYLVFADILFDILDEEPLFPHSKPAVFRFEDIHSKVHLAEIGAVVEAANSEQIPFNVALIPIFADPLWDLGRRPDGPTVPISMDSRFQLIKDFVETRNGSFIWHGVTHQYENIQNPHSGLSGSDFEFWDAVKNRPVAKDSVNWVLDRLQDGWDIKAAAGVPTEIWEVPHYQASPMNYRIFARVFPWNWGRVVYFADEVEGLPEGYAEEDLWYSTNPKGNKLRKEAFKNLRASYKGGVQGQFFPFEIYGDHYGQRVLPENLGNVQPYESAHVIRPRDPDDIIADAKRNLVLRDVWASFFLHSHLINIPTGEGIGDFIGDTQELRRIFREIKGMGYQFIDVNEFIQNRKKIRRPPVIWKDRER